MLRNEIQIEWKRAPLRDGLTASCQITVTMKATQLESASASTSFMTSQNVVPANNGAGMVDNRQAKRVYLYGHCGTGALPQVIKREPKVPIELIMFGLLPQLEFSIRAIRDSRLTVADPAARFSTPLVLGVSARAMTAW